ncbi:T9SS type A sorting domain-containing protein [Pseudofulvibacter geojedonensis]|uniref:DUF4832 domain-containing protein n=1 Tax=Pseudofulvibacter geojedonensis TaxID=1123758 RepID=A0ABW3HYI8_9FLAO
MKKILLLLLFVWSTGITQNNAITYSESNLEIANPERGIYHYTEAQSNNYVSLNQNQLENWRTNDNITMIIRIFYLKDFINSPISQSYLNKMQADFNVLRNAGLKAVIKFAYTENTSGAYDASKEQILSHLNQLSPILQSNSDVIAVMQAGFIGVWGEWYYTNHFGMPPNTNDYENRKDIVEAILGILPSDRMIQIRTPKLKQNMYNTNAITDAEGFNNSNKSRIGHHNDCFLASNDDYGTYVNISTEYPYLNQETKYTPMGGETCNNNSRSNCSNALTEMELFHWSYLNSDYHPDVLNEFNSGGCYSEIKNRLGYRFSLKNGVFPQNVSTDLNVYIEVENKGFATLYNPRTAFLVLRNTNNNDEFKIALNSDTRQWEPNTVTDINETLVLPNDIYDGEYELFLHLPDSRSSLANNPAYAIQLANTNTWESNTGYNKLNTTINVNNQALGITDNSIIEYTIHPVPANDKLIIELENINKYNIEIYNALGQKVIAQKNNTSQNKAVLQTSSLSNGIYILRITDGNSKLTKKIVINH